MSFVGGGVTTSANLPDNADIVSSGPADNASDADNIRNNAWVAFVGVNTANSVSITAYAICTTPTSIS